MLPERAAYRRFVVGDFKGACPLAHDFAKQSVVCYTLCQRCRFKCRCHCGGQGHLKRQESGWEFAAGEAAKDSPISTADRADMKPSSTV